MVRVQDHARVGVVVAVPGAFEVDLHPVDLPVGKGVIQCGQRHGGRHGLQPGPQVQFRRIGQGADLPARKILGRLDRIAQHDLPHPRQRPAQAFQPEGGQLAVQRGRGLAPQQAARRGDIGNQVGRGEDAEVRVAVGQLAHRQEGEVQRPRLHLLQDLRLGSQLARGEDQDVHAAFRAVLDARGHLGRAFRPLVRGRHDHGHAVIGGPCGPGQQGEGGPDKDGNLHAMLRVMRPVTASAPAPA